MYVKFLNVKDNHRKIREKPYRYVSCATSVVRANASKKSHDSMYILENLIFTSFKQQNNLSSNKLQTTPNLITSLRFPRQCKKMW